MKVNRQQKQRKGVRRPVQRSWHDMNRKQRRELTRKIQAEDLSLEVVHPDAAGIDIGNQSHHAAVPSSRDSQPVRCFGCTTWSCERWPHGYISAEFAPSPYSQRGLLDSGLRCCRGGRSGSVSGECAGWEDSAGAHIVPTGTYSFESEVPRRHCAQYANVRFRTLAAGTPC